MFAFNEALNKLRCSFCRKHLSHFPIRVADKNVSICGRCSPPSEENFSRDTSVETRMEFIQFPCSYRVNGCLEDHVPSDVPGHEKNCDFRPYKCPLTSNSSSSDEPCSWLGTRNNFVDHCEEDHKQLVLKNGGEFELKLVGTHEQLNVVPLQLDGDFLVTKIAIDATEKTCSFGLLEEAWPKSVSAMQVYLRAVSGTKRLHFDVKGSKSVTIEAVKKELGEPSTLLAQLNLKWASEEELAPEASAGGSRQVVNGEMLSELECPVCFHYMTPPIRQCPIGHSICDDCTGKCKLCPFCQKRITGTTQNFTLEKVTSSLFYPCRFNGCTYVGRPSKIADHKNFCMHSPQQCPLSDYAACQWRAPAKDIIDHVKAKHHDFFLDQDEVTQFMGAEYQNREDICCFVLLFARRVFKLHYRYQRGVFSWALQLFGTAEECKLFSFEVVVDDACTKEHRLFLTGKCGMFSCRYSCFQSKENQVDATYDQIKALVTDELRYSVRIYCNN